MIGILAIVVGTWCLVSPDKTLVALTYVFVAMFLMSGIFDIVFSISNRDALPGWGWTLTSGIFEILLGMLLMLLPLPAITMILIYLVGFWILFRSIWAIGESCQLQQMGVKGWGWLLTLGILSVLFSFIFLMSPMFGGVFIIVFVGLGLLFYGIYRIALGFKLKSIKKELGEIDD